MALARLLFFAALACGLSPLVALRFKDHTGELASELASRQEENDSVAQLDDSNEAVEEDMPDEDAGDTLEEVEDEDDEDEEGQEDDAGVSDMLEQEEDEDDKNGEGDKSGSLLAVQQIDSARSSTSGAKGAKETALKYMRARKKDDLKAIRKLLTTNAKMTIPRKMSGSDTYSGWTQIKKYLKREPYANVQQRGGDKVRMRSSKPTIDFEVYKFLAWRKLRATFKITSANKISAITVKKL